MIEQFFIVVLSGAGAWLTQDHRASWRRWACIIGLTVQPFWFYATWKAQQWGMFACSIWYTYVWLRGLKLYWLDVWAAQPRDPFAFPWCRAIASGGIGILSGLAIVCVCFWIAA